AAARSDNLRNSSCEAVVVWMNIQPALKIISLKVSVSTLKAQIRARRGGLLAAIAHAMGMGSTHTLSASPAGFRHETTSFSGEHKTFIPRIHVSASVFVMSKPIELLVLAASAVTLGGSLAAAIRAAALPFLLGGLALGLILV